MNLRGNYNLSTLGLIEDSWDHMGLLRALQVLPPFRSISRRDPLQFPLTLGE